MILSVREVNFYREGLEAGELVSVILHQYQWAGNQAIVVGEKKVETR